LSPVTNEPKQVKLSNLSKLYFNVAGFSAILGVSCYPTFGFAFVDD
jgi:hypothetical protein